MSDYEKYVEAAARAGDVWHATARAILEVVGPLIAEDTRVRMVEAAVKIMEREGFEDQRAQVAEEIAAAIEGQLVGLLDGFQARSAAAAAAREIGARNPS